MMSVTHRTTRSSPMLPNDLKEYGDQRAKDAIKLGGEAKRATGSFTSAAMVRATFDAEVAAILYCPESSKRMAKVLQDVAPSAVHFVFAFRFFAEFIQNGGVVVFTDPPDKEKQE